MHVSVSARTDSGARFRAPGGVLGSFTPGSAHIVLLYNIAIKVRQLFKQKHIFRSQNKYSISAVPFYYGLLTYSAKNCSILRKSMNMRASFENFRILIFYKMAITFESLLIIQIVSETYIFRSQITSAYYIAINAVSFDYL